MLCVTRDDGDDGGERPSLSVGPDRFRREISSFNDFLGDAGRLEPLALRFLSSSGGDTGSGDTVCADRLCSDGCEVGIPKEWSELLLPASGNEMIMSARLIVDVLASVWRLDFDCRRGGVCESDLPRARPPGVNVESVAIAVGFCPPVALLPGVSIKFARGLLVGFIWSLENGQSKQSVDVIAFFLPATGFLTSWTMRCWPCWWPVLIPSANCWPVP